VAKEKICYARGFTSERHRNRMFHFNLQKFAVSSMYNLMNTMVVNNCTKMKKKKKKNKSK